MSDEAVRCLFFPEIGPGREVILSVVDGTLTLPEDLGTETTQCLLPDGIMLIAKVAEMVSRSPVNRRIAGHEIRGPFLVTRCDSQCDPVSLTDKEVAFCISAALSEEDTSTPVSLGDDREVEIADIRVTYRKVKIPAKHSCGADLTRNESITVWSFSDEGFYGRLPRYSGDTANSFEERGALISEMGSTPKGGEEHLGNVCIVCVGCAEIIVEGELHVVQAD